MISCTNKLDLPVYAANPVKRPSALLTEDPSEIMIIFFCVRLHYIEVLFLLVFLLPNAFPYIAVLFRNRLIRSMSDVDVLSYFTPRLDHLLRHTDTGAT